MELIRCPHCGSNKISKECYFDPNTLDYISTGDYQCDECNKIFSNQ